MKKILLIICLFLHIATAAAQQDHAQLKAAVTAFIQQQTAGLPGKTTFSVDEIDRRVTLRTCSNIEVFLPAGSQLIGRVSVGVRCNEANSWSIFVPVQIKISRDLIISARPLTTGQVVHEEDIARQATETTQNIGLTDASLVIGKVLRYSIAARYIMREDMLRSPYFVKQGQAVQLSVQGSGFVLSSSGIALNNAGEGEAVQVRTNAGRVIGGIASGDGVVRINP
jgi:flagella basal body P-ring formation protein FlgA